MPAKSHFYKNINFSQLKRRIYLVLLPLLIVAFFIVFLNLGTRSEPLSRLNIFTFSTLLIGFSTAFILLLLKKSFLRFVEVIVCLIAAFIFLLRVYDNILHNMGRDGNVHLGTVSYWVPLLYLIYFFTFRGKTAFFFSAIIFSISLIPGIHHILTSPYVGTYTLDNLIQFYVATFAYIIILYFVQYILEQSLQVDIEKNRANTDYLTGLPNRRKMDKLLHEKIEKAQKMSTPLTVILFDVDDFKKVNDTFGHEAGDEVLQQYADMIQENLPDHVYFGRWGGEEFLIIADRHTLHEGVLLAEKIRQLLAGSKFKVSNQVTSSFGVAVLQDNELPKDLLKRADRAMYCAKQNGKNQVRDNDDCIK